jgi:hypothetical protein
MTSVLNVDTIADKAGTGPVGLTKQSAAKAYIYSPATSASITDSFNIASITDGGTGEQDMAFVSSMSDANYSSIVAIETVNMQNTGGNVRTVGVHSKTTSLIDSRADYILSTGLYAGGYEGVMFYNMSTHGDLA